MNFAKVAVPAPIWPFDTCFDYVVPDELREKIQAGSLVEVPLGRRKTSGIVFELSNTCLIDVKKLKPILSVKLELPVFDETRLQFLKWLSQYYFYPIGEVCESALPAAIREGTKRTLKLSAAPEKKSGGLAPTTGHDLNADQKEALEKILSLRPSTHLLWGITGSGKTEVYLQAIERVLSQGKNALLLVPEIALTPQLTGRFENRFPGEVAIFHSALKPKDLRKAWLETLQGQRRISIGARSALFAPQKNLGIIIVDEEHESSYKQEDRLRYNARDGAITLGAMLKIPVVLGSATPSAETFYEQMQGKLSVSKLHGRAVGEAKLPEIHVVDLKKSIGVENKTPLPPELFDQKDFSMPNFAGDFFLGSEMRSELDLVLERKQQAILFLNRRGLGSQEICRHCGHIMDCPNCDVKLTPHFRNLLCHYCAYQCETPKTCPHCKTGDAPFMRVGVGTEAIEESLKLHYPTAKVLRLDRDTITTAAELDSVITQFRNKEADILIGTQMVAKGHDFPDVTLVGILLGEMGLAVPDFRAYERNLQLLLQVSGRAGRGLHPGKVILQTFQPEHPVFEALKKQRGLEDYETFIKHEIEKRKELHYPPEGRLAILRFDGLDDHLVEQACTTVADSLRRVDSKKIRVLGPVVCPIHKVRNRYRWHILVKSGTHATLAKAIGWIFDGWQKQKMERKFKTRMLIDVDPLQMM